MRSYSVVTDIYECSINQTNWPSVLDKICAHLDAQASSLQVVDEHYSEHQIDIVSDVFGKDPESVQQYLNDYYPLEKHAYEYVRANACKGFLPETECLGFSSDDELHSHAPTQYLFDRFNIYYRYACTLTSLNTWHDYLCIQFSKEKGRMTTSKLEEANSLIPHFAKSIEIGRLFSVLKARYDSVIESLDRYRIGTLILTGDGTVVTMNEEARRILEDRDGISHSPRNSIRIGSDVQAELDNWIKEITLTARGQSHDTEAELVVSRQSKKDPYLVTIRPIADSSIYIGNRFLGVICHLLDPDFSKKIDTSGLSKLYGLTKAESEVCSLVVSGYSTRSISDIRSTSLETVRSQVKQILSKTNASSRTELVSLATKISLPIW